MRKCYIVEDGIKYEEARILGEKVLNSVEDEPPEPIRIIGGKLWHVEWAHRFRKKRSWWSNSYYYKVEWWPVTKDMLHVPEERKGEDE